MLADNPQQHRFASRNADPKHLMNSGSTISLLTGGKINPIAQQQRQGGPTNRSSHSFFGSWASKFRSKQPVLDEKLQEMFMKSRTISQTLSIANTVTRRPITLSRDAVVQTVKNMGGIHSVLQHPQREVPDDEEVTGFRNGEDENPDSRDPCTTKRNGIDGNHISKDRGSGGDNLKDIDTGECIAFPGCTHIDEIQIMLDHVARTYFTSWCSICLSKRR